MYSSEMEVYLHIMCILSSWKFDPICDKALDGLNLTKTDITQADKLARVCVVKFVIYLYNSLIRIYLRKLLSSLISFSTFVPHA